jgi:hypothetical protein
MSSVPFQNSECEADRTVAVSNLCIELPSPDTSGNIVEHRGTLEKAILVLVFLERFFVWRFKAKELLAAGLLAAVFLPAINSQVNTEAGAECPASIQRSCCKSAEAEDVTLNKK